MAAEVGVTQHEKDLTGHCWLSSRSRKRQEMDSPLEPPDGTQPCGPLDFSTGTAVSDV